MSKIDEAIALVEAEIENRNASCVIYSDGDPDESTLGGTRDGFLNIILALLKLIADFDQTSDDQHWDDQMKTNMLMLPSSETWLVGTEVFKEHAMLVARLKEMYQEHPDIIQAINNDPCFKEAKE